MAENDYETRNNKDLQHVASLEKNKLYKNTSVTVTHVDHRSFTMVDSNSMKINENIHGSQID